jgi:hypothetical protein
MATGQLDDAFHGPRVERDAMATSQERTDDGIAALLGVQPVHAHSPVHPLGVGPRLDQLRVQHGQPREHQHEAHAASCSDWNTLAVRAPSDLALPRS